MNAVALFDVGEEAIRRLYAFSVLGMIGTLASDLLLLWLDPRIRLTVAKS